MAAISTSYAATPPSDLLNCLKKLQAGPYFWQASSLRNQINQASPVALQSALESLIEETLHKGEDPLGVIKKLTPLRTLQNDLCPQGYLQTAYSLFEEAKIYLEAQKIRTPWSLQEGYTQVVNGLLRIIETILHMFGLLGIFDPAHTKEESQSKAFPLFMVINMIGILTTALVPIVGAEAVGSAILCVMATVALLSILWPWIKPTPTHLPGEAKNWTEEVKQERQAIRGRHSEVGDIAKILQSGHHPLLIGPTRVGKSLVAKAFTQMLNTSPKTVLEKYPRLINKTVFRIHMPNLVSSSESSNSGEGNRDLFTIARAMTPHNQKIILILDEIHAACKGEGVLAEQLKEFLDQDGQFPWAIGITTEKEYKKYIQPNAALNARFRIVPIKATEKDATLEILAGKVLSDPFKPLVTSDGLEKIYELTQNSPSLPHAATDLLDRCIQETNTTQLSQEEIRLRANRQEALSLRTQATASRMQEAHIQKLAALDQEASRLEKTILQQAQPLQKLFQMKVFLHHATHVMYTIAYKVHQKNLGMLSNKEKKEVSSLVLIQRLLIPYIEKRLKECSLGKIEMFIDAKLVERVARRERIIS